MSWRSLLIFSPAKLSIKTNQLNIELDSCNSAKIPLEDISIIILDNSRINITLPVLCKLADNNVCVLTVAENHIPNGIFTPYQGFHRGLKRIKSQLNLSLPLKKRLHQQIVIQKIKNQSTTCKKLNKIDIAEKLSAISKTVNPGDKNNSEATAALIYFNKLLDHQVKRREPSFFNSLLNYGYAVIRASIAKQISASGLHPSFGLFHANEQNTFNLADDLIEAFRPIFDLWVIRNFDLESGSHLNSDHKRILIDFLNQDIENNLNHNKYSVLNCIEQVVYSLVDIYETKNIKSKLFLPTH